MRSTEALRSNGTQDLGLVSAQSCFVRANLGSAAWRGLYFSLATSPGTRSDISSSRTLNPAMELKHRGAQRRGRPAQILGRHKSYAPLRARRPHGAAQLSPDFVGPIGRAAP